MKNGVLFQNKSEGILISVDLTNGFRERLSEWLNHSHPEIASDIEFHTGGTVSVSPEEIVFSADNGIFVLEIVDDVVSV